jgi:hypothetical protein
MATAVWIEFPPGSPMTLEVYERVNANVIRAGDTAPGLIFHSAGPSPDGGWRIIDGWESREDFDRSFQERVLPALTETLGDRMSEFQPPEVSDWPLANFHSAA